MPNPNHYQKKQQRVLSVKTLGILKSWEKNYGLGVLKDHLDSGLFSQDFDQQRLSYAWIKRRKMALALKSFLFSILITLLLIAASAYFLI